VILTGSANPDCSIRAWNPTTLKCLKNLKGHKDTVTSLLPMKDGVTLLSSSFENHILIWNMNTGKLFNKVTNHSKRINVLHHLKDNARFISAGDDKIFTVWKIIYDYSNELKKRIVSNCEVEKQFEDTCEILSVNSSTDDHNIVITGGTDSKVKVWNIEKNECIKQVFAHGLGVSSLLLFENPFKTEIYEKYLILSTGFAEPSIMGVKSGSNYAESMVKNDSMYVELGSNAGIKNQIVRLKGIEAPRMITINQRIGKGITIWKCE
jgi:WD40 repeat protein